jgi:hypothetical protein
MAIFIQPRMDTDAEKRRGAEAAKIIDAALLRVLCVSAFIFLSVPIRG